MEINFNTNFKEFKENSQVYQNLVQYLKDSDTYKEADKSLKKKYEIALETVFETMVQNHELLNNIHYSRMSVKSLVNDNNSENVQKFAKKDQYVLEYMRPFTYLYFTEENKELTTLRNEINQLVPNEKVTIDFNKNYKNFLENSVAYQEIVKRVKEDKSYKTMGDKQPMFLTLTQLAMESIILNWEVFGSSSFSNSSLVTNVARENSKEVKKFVKENKENNITHLAEFIKNLVRLNLYYPIDSSNESPLIQEVFEQEFEAYNENLKSTKKLKM